MLLNLITRDISEKKRLKQTDNPTKCTSPTLFALSTSPSTPEMQDSFCATEKESNVGSGAQKQHFQRRKCT